MRAEQPRILHVEDEALNRSLLRAVLDRARDPRVAGARLEEAASLRVARDFLAAHHVDLVLLDVRLPDGNGLDLVREIKASQPDLPVVVMSASVLPHEREEASRAGCDAFVSKPYLAQDLLDTIGRLLPDEA
jgi:two-component system KDP operon response regulator KdpE